MTTALEGGEGPASLPDRSLPPGKTRYPLYRRLDGPQGLSGQVRKISPPPGFDPPTVQPVASYYTDYATRPTTVLVYLFNFNIAISSIVDVIFVLPWLAVHNVVGHKVGYSMNST
jgi:hypothetical protein